PLSETNRQLLRQSISDLQHSAELLELGMALFLDRPLGTFKRPGEPDQTPLLSYEAFSRSIAEGRLRQLYQSLDLGAGPHELEESLRRLRTLPGAGLPIQRQLGPVRPGVASLQDALQVADDFVLLRTTRRTAQEFLGRFDLSVLAGRDTLDYLDTGKDV